MHVVLQLTIRRFVFGKAIHSLSKIGEEVYFEPLDHGLALRTVNASRSAYACFIFAPSFFLHYHDGVRQGTTVDGDEEAIKCKVGVKSCLTVFRSLSTLEKTVERCQVTLNMEEARLVFQLHCRHGIVKTHNLAFIECETLQAVFSKDMTPNKLTAQSRLLCDAVVHFQNNQEEVTLSVSPEKLLLKNYVDDEPDPHKVMRTELGMEPGEFEDYRVGIDGDVTFCLKELRAILAFSDSANLPISLNFESAGRPIVFSIDSDSTFEANFVLATLADPSNSQASSQQSTQRATQNQPRSTHTIRKTSYTTPRPPPRNKLPNGTPHMGNGDSNNTSLTQPEKRRSTDNVSPNLQISYQDISINHTTVAADPDPMEGTSNAFTSAEKEFHSRTVYSNVTNHHKSKPPSVQSHGSNRLLQDGVSKSSSQKEDPSFESANQRRGSDGLVANQKQGEGSGNSVSPVIPVQPSKRAGRSSVLLGEDSDETASEDEDLVPGTPPAKKFKSMFVGWSQSTTQDSQQNSQSRSQPEVLAEDTDEDD